MSTFRDHELYGYGRIPVAALSPEVLVENCGRDFLAIAPQVVAQLTPPAVLLLAREHVLAETQIQLDLIDVDQARNWARL